MNQETELVRKYRSLAEGILAKDISSKLTYHNIDHTRYVVAAFYDIGKASNLSERELELGTIAAWFHDTGYTKATKLHEHISVDIFNENISDNDFTKEEKAVIEKLIMCTRMPQTPVTTLEKVLCDADLRHIGTDSFVEQSELLKKEVESVTACSIKREKWNLDSYFFLKEHNFFTPYAKETYTSKKADNQKILRQSIKEFSKQDKIIKGLEDKLEKLNGKLMQKPSRGIETMFRITARNHLELSGMADTKANIMISINTILISVVLTIGGARIVDNPQLLFPVTFLVIVCLSTIVLAVLATRPSISKGTFTKDDIINKKTNLLFFGNFHGMEIEDYQWGVAEMMKDADYLYSSLTRDIFFLGKVLARKYKMLRIAYTTFMIGFVISILMFVISIYLNRSPIF